MPLSSLESIRHTLTLEAACQDAPYGLLVLDKDLIVRYANNTAATLLGSPLEEMGGQSLFAIVPHTESRVRPWLEEILHAGKTRHLHEFPSVVLGRESEGLLYWDTTYSPIREGERIVGVLVQFVEATDRVRARRAEQERTAELDAVFVNITDGLAIISADGSLVRMNPAGERILRGSLPAAISLDEAAAFLTIRYPDTALPMDTKDIPSARALRGETVIGQEQLLRDGIGTDIILSVNAAPLLDPQTKRPIGAVSLFRDVTNVKRLEAETASAHARSRRIAQTLQASLLPEVPLSFDEMSMGLAFEAAWIEEADVGGDLLDYFFTDDNTRAHLVIADVSGKGLLAARRTALIKYTVRALALSGMDITRVATALNTALLNETDFEGFVTLFYAVLDLTEHTLQYINAGHEPGLLWDGPAQSVQPLSSTGLPLGILREQEGAMWTVSSIPLRPTDALLLYTDGFTEAPELGKSRRLLGEERSQALFREALRLPDGPMSVNYILSATHAHAGPRLRDDLALLLLRGHNVSVD